MTKQPIVPLKQLPISRKFEKKAKNALIFRCKMRELNLSFTPPSHLNKLSLSWIRYCPMTINLSDLGQVYLVCEKQI